MDEQNTKLEQFLKSDPERTKRLCHTLFGADVITIGLKIRDKIKQEWSLVLDGEAQSLFSHNAETVQRVRKNISENSLPKYLREIFLQSLSGKQRIEYCQWLYRTQKNEDVEPYFLALFRTLQTKEEVRAVRNFLLSN